MEFWFSNLAFRTSNLCFNGGGEGKERREVARGEVMAVMKKRAGGMNNEGKRVAH